MPSYSTNLTAILLIALLGFASASDWKKTKHPYWKKGKWEKKHYETETSVAGAGGAAAYSKKKPGSAYASSLDIGTALATPHFSGTNTVDTSKVSAMVEYADAAAGGSTKAYAANHHGYTDGKSGTMSEAGEAGAYYPDIDADAKADGFFGSDAKGPLSFTQGGQTSYASVDDYNGYADAGSMAGTRSYQDKTAAGLFFGGLGTELATTQGILRLMSGDFVPISALAAGVTPELVMPLGMVLEG